MNNWLKVCGFCLLYAGLFGCTHLPSHVWYYDTETLIAQHRYVQAIEQLKLENTPDNAVKIRAVETKAQAYTRLKIDEIKQLNLKKRWRESLNIIKELHDQVPKQHIITDTESSTRSLMLEQLRLINTQVAIEQAQLLQLKIKQLDALQNSDLPKTELTLKTQSINQETLNLAKQLIELSIQAIAHSDYDYAAKTYALATRFNPTLGKAQLNKTINNGLSQNRTKSIQTRQANLLIKLKQALLDHNVDDILATEHILAKPPFQGSAVKKALLEVQKYRNERGQHFDVLADSQYRNGQLQDAINNWKNALELTPLNGQIKSKLQRAQNVFEKMELLQSNSSGTQSKP